MWRLYVPLLLAWLAVLPPLFTNGTCQKEFEDIAAQAQSSLKSVDSSARALQYWATRGVPATVLSDSECRKASSQLSLPCGEGSLVVAYIPVQSTVCRVYRDEDVLVLFQFDKHDRLVRFASDMNPYKSLPLPFSSVVLHWAR